MSPFSLRLTIQVCLAATDYACTCAGVDGTQTCNEDGSAVGACDCARPYSYPPPPHPPGWHAPPPPKPGSGMSTAALMERVVLPCGLAVVLLSVGGLFAVRRRMHQQRMRQEYAALLNVAGAWAKWPSWLGHGWPPRARQTASEGLGLAFCLVRSDPAPQIPSRGRSPGATPDHTDRLRRVGPFRWRPTRAAHAPRAPTVEAAVGGRRRTPTPTTSRRRRSPPPRAETTRVSTSWTDGDEGETTCEDLMRSMAEMEDGQSSNDSSGCPGRWGREGGIASSQSDGVLSRTSDRFLHCMKLTEK